MVKSRLLLAAGGLVGLSAVWLLWLWLETPRTPAELFARRCSNCHKLPDLSAYRRQDIRGIVDTMLTKNGADKVITPEEARTITAWLEEAATP